MHGGRDWLEVLGGARPRTVFTRSLKQMFVSHHASVGHSLRISVVMEDTEHMY